MGLKDWFKRTSPEQIAENYQANGVIITVQKIFDHTQDEYTFTAIVPESWLIPHDKSLELDITKKTAIIAEPQNSYEAAIVAIDKILKTATQEGKVLLVPSSKGYIVLEPTGKGRSNPVDMGPIPFSIFSATEPT